MVRFASGDTGQKDRDRERQHRGLQPFRLGKREREAREFGFCIHGI